MDDQEGTGAEEIAVPEDVAEQAEAKADQAKSKKAGGFKGALKFARKNKRKLIVGGAVGGVIASGLIGLLALLPLKLDFLVQNIEGKTMDKVEIGVERRSERYFEAFVNRSILPGKRGGTNLNFEQLATGSFGRDLWQAWQTGKLEDKLRADQGIEFGYDKGTGKSFVVVHGTETTFDRDFRFANLSNKDARAVIREAVSQEAKRKPLMRRRHARQLLRNKYGVKNWRLFESYRDRIANKTFTAKKALKLEMIDRVVKPVSPRFATYFKAIIEGGSVNDLDKDPNTGQAVADNIASGSKPDDQLTPEERQARAAELGQAGAGGNAVDEAVTVTTKQVEGEAADQADKFVGQQLLDLLQQEMTKKILASVGFGIGLLEIISKMDHAITNHTIDRIVEDKNKLQYASLWSSYATLNSQLKEGKLKSDEVSAVMSRLDGVEKSRVYGKELNTGVDPSWRTCGSGAKAKQLDPSRQVCGDKMVKSNFSQTIADLPGYQVLHAIAVAYDHTIGPAVKLIGGIVNTVIKAVFGPLISALTPEGLIQAGIDKIMGFFFGPVISGNETGQDLFDGMYAGSEVTANDLGHFTMGGKRLTPDQAKQLSEANITNQTEIAATKGLEYQLASLQNPASVASKLIGALPFGPKGATSSFMAALMSPFKLISHGLLGLVPQGQAFNGTSAFGIDYYGIPLTDPYYNRDPIDQPYTKAECDAMEKAWTEERNQKLGANDSINYCRSEKFVVEVNKSMFTTDDDGGLGDTSQPAPATGAPAEVGVLKYPPNLGQPVSPNYYEMPPAQNREYGFNSCAAHHFGQKDLTGLIYTAAIGWKAKYTDSILEVGDMDAAGHNSHFWGKAVDLYMQNNKAMFYTEADLRNPNSYYLKEGRNRSIEMGKIILNTKIVQNIWFDDPVVTNALKDYARANGLPFELIQEPTNVPNGHHNHFHVDISAPRGPQRGPVCSRGIQ